MVLVVILAIAMAIGIVLIFQGLLSQSSTQSELLEARLSQFSESGRTVSSLTEAELTLPFFERAVRPTFEKLSTALARAMPNAQRQALQDKINLAGRPAGLTAGGFTALRILSLLVGTSAGLAVGALVNDGTLVLVVATAVGFVLGLLVPEAGLNYRVRRRQKMILLGLPSALDLLTISVEAGLGFDAALARVAEKYRNPLTAEIQITLNEIRLGRARLEALEDLGRRSKVEELNNFCQAIIQSEQLGVAIANVLRIQSEEIRRRRRQRAEEAGQKAPLKMLFPMVFCIFPTLFLVLLGPAFIVVSNTVFK